MPADLRISSLIPAGLIVASIIQNGDMITVTTHADVKNGDVSSLQVAVAAHP